MLYADYFLNDILMEKAIMSDFPGAKPGESRDLRDLPHIVVNGDTSERWDFVKEQGIWKVKTFIYDLPPRLE